MTAPDPAGLSGPYRRDPYLDYPTTKNTSHWKIAAVILAVIVSVLALGYFNRTMTVQGTMETAGKSWMRDSPCTPLTVGPGQAVTVYDANGTVLGRGQINDDGVGSPGYKCIYTFTVNNVRAGEDMYLFTVDGLGTIPVVGWKAEHPALFEK